MRKLANECATLGIVPTRFHQNYFTSMTNTQHYRIIFPYRSIIVNHQVKKSVHRFFCHVREVGKKLGNEASSKPLLSTAALGCRENIFVCIFELKKFININYVITSGYNYTFKNSIKNKLKLCALNRIPIIEASYIASIVLIDANIPVQHSLLHLLKLRNFCKAPLLHFHPCCKSKK